MGTKDERRFYVFKDAEPIKVITNDKGYLQQLLGVNLVFPGKGMTPGKYGKYAKTNPAPYMKEHYK